MQKEIKLTEYQPTKSQQQELVELETRFRQTALSYGQNPESDSIKTALKKQQTELKRIWLLNTLLQDISSTLSLCNQTGEPLQIEYQLIEPCLLSATLGPESLYDINGARNGIISSARYALDQEIILETGDLNLEDRIEMRQNIIDYYLERYAAHCPTLKHCGINLHIDRQTNYCIWIDDSTGEQAGFGCTALDFYRRFGDKFWATIKNTMFNHSLHARSTKAN